ncbi:MAG TPA: GlsB/YeaQ/YmgE family stress response membrane protein [Egibacteraceae bacterium]|nr:GlsB/YeaQ/YmgE family stress response membrane protein [Actinomycetota bacterium]HWB72791.1 GlsB/YeaQ/YmgE family stress response membrane protein [Egibacteraceae bacterium]
MDILAILLGGLIVGALARLVVPGPEPIGCLGTIAIGVVGGAIGGFVGTQLVGGPTRRPLLGLLFSVLGAVVLLLLLRAAYGRGRV